MNKYLTQHEIGIIVKPHQIPFLLTDYFNKYSISKLSHTLSRLREPSLRQINKDDCLTLMKELYNKINIYDDIELYSKYCDQVDNQTKKRFFNSLIKREVDIYPILEHQCDLPLYLFYIKKDPSKINQSFISDLVINGNHYQTTVLAYLNLLALLPPSLENLNKIENLYKKYPNTNIREKMLPIINNFPIELKEKSIIKHNLENLIEEEDTITYGYNWNIRKEILKSQYKTSSNIIDTQILRFINFISNKVNEKEKIYSKYSGKLIYESNSKEKIERIKNIIKPYKANIADFAYILTQELDLKQTLNMFNIIHNQITIENELNIKDSLSKNTIRKI